MSITGTRFVTVVGIDFSPISLQALDEALALASLRRGEVHVVYVDPPLADDLFATPASAQAASTEAALEKAQRCAQERVNLASARPEGISVTRVVAHVRHGSPAQEIADFAASVDADLVVVGSHGRHGVPRLLLGSVAERVVRLARCPVWIVRAKDHAAELKVPEIAPVCADCLARREATGGSELWCARHAERHGRAHRYAYVQEGVYAAESAGYHSTPE